MVELNFEKSLKQLETIVERLESGELSLEESLKQFEEGMKLTQGLNQKLEDAQRKVELLLKNPDGSASRKSLETPGTEDGGEAGLQDKPKARKAKKSSHEQNTLF